MSDSAAEYSAVDLFSVMLLLGITGGIGMGKSAAAVILEKLRIPVVDTDVIAREVSTPSSPAVREIVERFGPDVLDEAGGLRRSHLADVIFADTAARRELEAILHPKIAAAWRERSERWRERGESLAAVVIPLLYENDYGSDFDEVVCVACSRATQMSRLRERSWTESQIIARNAAQLPVGEKMARANFVVWTEGAITGHSRQWERILGAIAPSTCSRV